MSILEGIVDEGRGQHSSGRRYICHTARTVSGNAGARIINGSNAEYTIVGNLIGFGATVVPEYEVVCMGTFVASSDNYQPEMVERLLRLDAEAPEAKFNNVIDMMDWLDRD
jgi:hypothetical protein